jgi:hypothetical protein
MAEQFKPGDAITWTHYFEHGTAWQPPLERTGTVWSAAMLDTGIGNAWWVHADEPLPGDIYHMIYVGRASGRGPCIWEDEPARGEVHSSNRSLSVPAVRMATAAKHAAETRAARTSGHELAA